MRLPVALGSPKSGAYFGHGDRWLNDLGASITSHGRR